MKKANLRRAGDALRRATRALVACLTTEDLSPHEGTLFELHDNLDTAYRELEMSDATSPIVGRLRRTLVRLGSCAAALMPYHPESGVHPLPDHLRGHGSHND